MIQLTGHSNYAQLTKHFGINFLEKPELLSEPKFACWSAAWFWDKTKLNAVADKDDIFLVTRRVNGGYNGFQDRIDKLIKLYIEAKVDNIEDRINKIFDRIIANMREPIADKRLYRVFPNLLKAEKLRNEYLQKIGVKKLHGNE